MNGLTGEARRAFPLAGIARGESRFLYSIPFVTIPHSTW